MHLLPDTTEIKAIAASLGASLGDAEAEQYRPHLIDLLRTVDEFVQSRPAPEASSQNASSRFWSSRIRSTGSSFDPMRLATTSMEMVSPRFAAIE